MAEMKVFSQLFYLIRPKIIPTWAGVELVAQIHVGEGWLVHIPSSVLVENRVKLHAGSEVGRFQLSPRLFRNYRRRSQIDLRHG